jgi:hypothetical protein
MLMSRTFDTSSRPWHCQYTHTSPGVWTREANLLEGAVAGCTAGPPIVLITVVNRPPKHGQAI